MSHGCLSLLLEDLGQTHDQLGFVQLFVLFKCHQTEFESGHVFLQLEFQNFLQNFRQDLLLHQRYLARVDVVLKRFGLSNRQRYFGFDLLFGFTGRWFGCRVVHQRLHRYQINQVLYFDFKLPLSFDFNLLLVGRQSELFGLGLHLHDLVEYYWVVFEAKYLVAVCLCQALGNLVELDWLLDCIHILALVPYIQV